MPPRVAHPDFYDKSTGPVHRRLVQGLKTVFPSTSVYTPFAFKKLKNFLGWGHNTLPKPHC